MSAPRTLAIAVLAASLAASCGPSATSTGSPTSSGASAAPGSTRQATATPEPAATPSSTSLDGVSAQVLTLPAGTAPLAVTFAFGSIWVAGHRTDSILRFDPATMELIAAVRSGSGPGEFAVTADALWVTNQLGVGMTRIDPTSNKAVASVGTGPPCGLPIVALGDAWYIACDVDVIQRIDDGENKVARSFEAKGHGGLVAIGDSLIAIGPDGLARFDPETGAFTELGGPSGTVVGLDGETLWLSDGAKVVRVDPDSGEIISTIEVPNAQRAHFADGHAWITAGQAGLVEIDMATGQILRTIPVLPTPFGVTGTGDALWVTDFDENVLWRVAP